MAVRFTCTNARCRRTLQVKDELAGKQIKCPACGCVQVAAVVSNLVERFSGLTEGSLPGQLIANDALEHPPSLQVLFAKPFMLASERLTELLRAYHPSTARGQFEVEAELLAKGTPLGLAGWGDHVIKLVGFNLPMPAAVVEQVVQPAHYPQEVKEKARQHQSHVILYYAGQAKSPLEQYLALTVVAGVLAAAEDAVIVANEDAHTSFPAKALRADAAEGDALDYLRTLPLLMLYAGFVKMEIEGQKGVWMRTCGLPKLGLPDLAYRAKGHFQGEFIFEAFSNICSYLLESHAELADGHTMQLADDVFVKLRHAKKKENFLQSDGELFVLEPIREDEINR